jgi:nitroreductase
MTTLDTAATPTKQASPDCPIHPLLAERWSPYGFTDQPVAENDLRALFEAARWAPSSYNEQPWTYLVATRQNLVEFNRLLSCLVPGNQAWAKTAPVLILGLVTHKFAKNQQDNRAAVHDLGLASANLVLEATARGLSVHQMIGILPEVARKLYQIPQHTEAWTAIAVGHRAEAADLPAELRTRDLAPRTRKPTSQFVFTGGWGHPGLSASPTS